MHLWLGRAVVAITGLAALADVPKPEAAAPKPALPGIAVVELFTSEGCNSCPPADRLMARMSEQQEPGDGVYLLAWHVDYWDRLGWKDPFALAAASRRQRDYEHRMPEKGTTGSGVYTPQTIINAERAMVGSDEGAVRAGIAAARSVPAQTAVTLTLSPAKSAKPDAAPAGTQASGPVRVTAKFDPPLQGLTAVAVLTEDGLVSSVKAGENSGRTLRHERVVRTVATAPVTGDSAELVLDMPPGIQAARARVIVFAQRADLGPIVGAASAGVPTPAATK